MLQIFRSDFNTNCFTQAQSVTSISVPAHGESEGDGVGVGDGFGADIGDGFGAGFGVPAARHSRKFSDSDQGWYEMGARGLRLISLGT